MSQAEHAVAVLKPQQVAIPQQQFSFGDLERMAEAVAKSGLFGWKTKEQALTLMLVAQAEGQHPATIAHDYDLIQGKPARKTHSVLSRFFESGGRLEWKELSATKAVGVFCHPRGVQTPTEIEWTIEMAKAAQLGGKDNWKNYPRAMLRARVIAEGVRAVYPAAIGGMLVREEALDELNVIDHETGEVIQPRAKSQAAPAKAAEREQATQAEGEQTGEPKAATAPAFAGGLTAGMLKMVRAKIQAANENVGLTEDKVCEKFEVKTLEEIPAARVNDVIGFIANPG